jgi:hypothetical protein
LAKQDSLPYSPPKWELPDVYSFQALQKGEANCDQQKHVLSYIIKSLCGTYDLSYRPTSDRDTAFAEGKRFVGLQIVKMLNMDIAAIKQARKHDGNSG